MSLRCYVLCTGCHRLPTPFQHFIFPLWRQLPGSAKIRTPDKQNNPCVLLRKQTEQMGNCFLTPWKPGGFLCPAPRKQDLSGIFVKNKVPLPTAEKLLIHWLRHLPRAVEQPKWVLTFLYSEQRAEIPFPRNHRVSAIPGEFVPVLYPSVPFPHLQISIWVWAILPVQIITFLCRTCRCKKWPFSNSKFQQDMCHWPRRCCSSSSYHGCCQAVVTYYWRIFRDISH